jgi:hypothetical protein
METNNKIDVLLKKHLALDHAEIPGPSPALVKKARLKIAGRNKRNEKGDFYFLVAGFLNAHIKLYYVAVLAVCLGLGGLYFSKENISPDENVTSPAVVNIASARSSTVLSSIITFETRR